MSDSQTVDGFIKNFPFQTLRERQSHVLNEIATGFASGYKHIILEDPTGFGKSPVAIAVGRTLGTSYICTSTKDLQTQYATDFPFLKVAKGKNNFICAVKEDFIKNGTFKCGLCTSNKAKECHHTTADYGPCKSNESFRIKKKKSGCKYRTFREHYKVKNKETIEEQVFIDEHTTDYYQQEYSQWVHLRNLKKPRSGWTLFEYYDQLNVALTSSHSIFNYSNFLAFLLLEPLMKEVLLPYRELLILDEAHRLEEEIVKFVGISISKKRWKRHIPNFEIVDYGYNDVENDLEAKALKLTQDVSEELVVEAMTDKEKLIQAIDNVCSNPKNWLVTEIKKENNEVTRVELKPLDVSSYCKGVFGKCNKTLMISATILDKDAFCASLGLAPEDVKFIQVPSDFPLQNRPIHPLNIAYLNSDSLKQQEIQIKVARTIDKLMSIHKNHKGIIHTTSYKQLDFINHFLIR